MELSFDNKKLRNLCEDEDKAKLELGAAIAEKLRTRLADLVAGTVRDIEFTGELEIIPSKPHSICKIDLGDGVRLVFCSNHIDQPLVEGDIDWNKVFRIRILKIGKNDE